MARPAAGLLMEQEVKYLGHILEAPEQWLALFHPIWPDLEQAQMRDNGKTA